MGGIFEVRRNPWEASKGMLGLLEGHNVEW